MLKQIKNEYGNLNMNHLKKLSDEEVYNTLLKYKGIGVKTVSCVLVFAMNRKVFPVDTHIHRVLNRIGIVKTKSPEETFEMAKRIIPDDEKIVLHKAIIKFGRNICKAVKPMCYDCFLYDECLFKDKYQKANSRKQLEQELKSKYQIANNRKQLEQELKSKYQIANNRKQLEQELKSNYTKIQRVNTELHREEQEKRKYSGKNIRKENNFIILENI